MTENATSIETATRGAEFGLAELADEGGVLLGAGTAVMFQLALHGVGKGVSEHSNTLDRPVDRLRTTLTYVYVMACGTDEERKTVARLVNKVHVPIKGEGYSAFDPQLQLWVAATLAQVGREVYEKLIGPMDEVTAERVYREGWIYGTALQVKPEMWPPTLTDFDDYWVKMQGEFTPDPQVQRYARAILSTKSAPWFAKPTQALISLLTRGNLTPEARTALALPWSARDQRRYDAFWRVAPKVYALVPGPVRKLPRIIVLRDARRRMRAHKHLI